MAKQSVPAKLALAARAPLMPRAKLAATHVPSTRRPMSPLSQARETPPHIPTHGLHPMPVPEFYPRWEAPAIGAKGNPLPRYMFRPQRQAFVPQIHPTRPLHG